VQRLTRIAIWLLAGFLAFAPPGTLIFLSAMLFAWIGDPWLFAAVLTAIAAAGVVVWRRRRRAANRAEPVEPS